MIRVHTAHAEVPSEVYDWLDNHVHNYWTSHPAIYARGGNGRVFYFDDNDGKAAMLFKLVWA